MIEKKSFHELLNYLESFCYKSNIDGNYAKQDIINILNNWEIRNMTEDINQLRIENMRLKKKGGDGV